MSNIDSIDTQGNFTWHCNNPGCSHHNCAAWGHRICNAHHLKGQRVSGQTHRHHVSHQEVQWRDNGREIDLPECHCGERHNVVVSWSDAELAPPIITRGVHPVTGKEGIIGVEIVGAPNFTRVRSHLEKHEVDGETQIVEIIDGVDPHPAIANHQEFARQVTASGKVPPQ